MTHHADGVRDDGFDDLLDAIEAGSPYFLRCENGHGSLPPRRVCPHCGSQALAETLLPEHGTVETYTTISITTPLFADDAPYTTAIADFGDVRVTGVLDADPDDASVGMTVGVAVGESATTGDRILQLVPR